MAISLNMQALLINVHLLTAICEPECKNGSRCTSPGMCSGAKNQSGNNCKEDICA